MTVLTAVMIGGLVIIIVLFVMRFPAPQGVVPDSVTLPDGVKAEAFTMTPDWYAVVTEDGRQILIFDRASGALKQTVAVD